MSDTTRRDDEAAADPSSGDLLVVTRALREVAAELDPALKARADELVGRLGEGRFRVAVCGGFSNGKSTLINALLGAPVLPVGVLPVTAVPTEVVTGPSLSARIDLIGGGFREPPIGELADWVSEQGNPANIRGASRIVVTAPSSLLEPGVTLVDTPGLESIFEHNDAAAMATIREAEGALVVLSADAPMTASDRRLLDVVAERSSATFFVLNRVDHLDRDEVERAVEFVATEIEAATGVAHPLFAVSARGGLRAALMGRSDDATGLASLRGALDRFVAHDLVAVRARAFATAVGRLADAVEDADALSEAMATLTVDELDGRIRQFNDAANRVRLKLDEDTVLLTMAVKRINTDLAGWSREAGHAGIQGAERRFAATAERVPLRHLEAALDDDIRALVETRFDEVRPLMVERVERAWRQAATEFTERVQQRVDAIRTVASAEFGAELRPIPIPAVAEEPDRFWYLFFRPELPDAGLYRVLRLLLPHGYVRRRLVRKAQRRLRDELDKHAGRARSELAERLTTTHRRFDAELTTFVSALLEDIRRATDRAQTEARQVGAIRQQHQDRHRRVAGAVALARSAIAVPDQANDATLVVRRP